MYNNFEKSLAVFMPNITTNHAITYTYLEVTKKLQLLDFFAVCLNLFVDSQLNYTHSCFEKRVSTGCGSFDCQQLFFSNFDSWRLNSTAFDGRGQLVQKLK